MSKYILATLIIFGGLFNTLTAGIERMTTRIAGNQIFIGQSLSVLDNKYPNVDVSGTAFVNYSVGKITLGIDYAMPSTNYNLNSYAFNYDVVVKITYILANGTMLTSNQKLRLDYKSTAGTITDKSFAIIKDAHVMSITIDHFENPSNSAVISAPFIPDNLYLEAEIETERFYTLNVTNTPIINHNLITASNELEVYWNSIVGAEEYEVEWTYVNNYNTGSLAYDYNTASASTILTNPYLNLDFTFLNNATKIRTSKNSFRIGLNYNSGLLVYRIRAIGKDISNITFEKIGNWSLDQNQTTPSFKLSNPALTALSFDDYYVIPAGHEANKNWQYTATYAEDGKKKEVISYFDGSLRNRQSVTKTNTEDISIVAETIYDKQGRATVQILPTPTTNYLNEIKYYENFNQSDLGSHEPFGKPDLEISSAPTCPFSPGPLYTATGAEGASMYYSPLNTKHNENQNAFIPDAQKYPFTTTVYTPDNTGRVKYQSGVGITHQIGSGHETKYLYADPDQEDLDKLFGSEAGYVERYKKNTVIDPNGQISISYLNTENKVVATALAGNSPNNVNSINSTNTYSTQVQYFDYHDTNYDQINKPNGTSITFGKKIVPTVTGTYTFTYNLLVPAYTDTCIPNFCYDCVYDLDIEILDECGVALYSNIQKVGLNSASAVDYTCGGTPIIYTTIGALPPFLANLQAGKEYLISKTLTIDNAALINYTAHYMDTISHNNICIKTVKDFTASPTATVSSLGCDMTCDQCAAKVETYYTTHNQAYYTLHVNDAGFDPNTTIMSLPEKEAAIKECRKPCTNVSLCEVEFGNLLQDVTPNGQYAQYNLVAGAIDAAPYELSLFNDANKLPLTNQSCVQTSYTAFGVTYDIPASSTGLAGASWKYPEYYNQTTFNFTSPSTASKNHYFNADFTVGKVYLTLSGLATVGTNYTPHINNTSLVSTDAIGLWTYPENLSDVKDFISNYISHPTWALSLVKFHPEFNYFLDCARQSKPSLYGTLTSLQYDDLLQTTDTYLAAKAYPLAVTDDNVIDDLINADPYFHGIAPGAGLFTIFKNRLNNFLQIPGSPTFINIKAAAAAINSTANMFYSNCQTIYGHTSLPSCADPSIVITTTQLDGMWKAYRAFYLSEKNKFLIELSHREAVYNGTNSNYFNGAIGDPHFDEWNAHANYGFNPWFPYGFGIGSGFGGGWALFYMINVKHNPNFYPNCPTQSTPPNYYYPSLSSIYISGFYDFGAPSSFYHKDKYSSKSRRFIDLQTLNNNLAGGATDPAAIIANLQNQANNDAQLNSGECPVYKRLEFFLSSTLKNGSLTNTVAPHPLVNEGSFSRDLYDQLIVCAALTPTATWYPDLGFKTTINPTTNQLTLSFYKGIMSGLPTLITGSDITLTPPAISGFNWAYVKLLTSIHYSGAIPSGDAFTVMGLYQTSPTDVPQSISINGTTGCIKKNCSPPAPLTCKPTQQAIELLKFFNAVAADANATGPTHPFPVDLGDPNNYSSQNFSALVRYPFGNTIVAAGTHSVNVLNSSSGSTIKLYGLNTDITSTTNVDVFFNFVGQTTALTYTNLVGFTGFSNIVPKQNPADPYDFTIQAIYGSGSSTSYQTFSVTIIYTVPGYSCGSGGAFKCFSYKMGNCNENVSSSCANDDNYQVGVDFYNFMQEALQSNLTATPKPLNTFANYTSLLKSKIGANATIISGVSLAGGTTYNTATNYSKKLFELSFINTNVSPQATLCTIPLTLTLYGNWSVQGGFNNIYGYFDDFKVLDESTGAFEMNYLSTNGNDYTISGLMPCINMHRCEPCPISDTIFKEDFDMLSTSSTSISINFTNSSGTPTTVIPFGLATVTQTSNAVSFIGEYNSVSVTQLDLNKALLAGCFGNGSNIYDHTKIHLHRNYLVTISKNISGALTPYIKAGTKLKIGKQYEFSVYVRTCAGEVFGPSKKVQLVTQNNNIGLNPLIGTSEIIIASKTYTDNPQYNREWTVWRKIEGFFTATDSLVDLKIQVIDNNPLNPNSYDFSLMLDDIMLREKQCENPPLFVPPSDFVPEKDCQNQMANIQTANAQHEMVQFLNQIKKDFQKNYTEKCLKSMESMQARFNNSEGHYTLYYYDQAGNLIKTIPPEGVEPLNLTNTYAGSTTIGAQIALDRTNHTKTVFTNHRLATRYEYNSLNQLVKQSMPDHALAEQWDVPVNNNLPANLTTTGMDFADSQNGYMTANDGAVGYIYSTQNGGQTWAPISALGLDDMIDFEVSGTNAFVITSDGNLLKSTNYNAASPAWTFINIPNSNLMALSDISFITPTIGYITGKNGLLLKTMDAGVTWNTETLPTTANLTKVNFKNDGTTTYIVVTGEGGTLFYKNSTASTWTQYGPLSTLIDLSDCAIVNNGDGLTSFLNLIVCGQDKSVLPHKAMSLQLVNINSANVTYPPSLIALTMPGISATNASKYNTIVGNTYLTLLGGGGGFAVNNEFYLGGITQSIPPKPLFTKLTNTLPSLAMVATNIASTTLPDAGITKLSVKTPNGAATSDAVGVLTNGQLFKYDATAVIPVNITANLNTIGSTINNAQLNGMWLDPTSTNLGYAVGNNGTIISFNELISTTGVTSNAINTITNPNLYGITAAKDGSGHVYAVGNTGTIIHSSNSGSTWQNVPSTITIDLKAALYIAGPTPKVVIAGVNSFVDEYNITTDIHTTVSAASGNTTYKTIKQANAPATNSIFLVGENLVAVNQGVIDKYTLGTTALTSVYTAPLSINDIGFTIPNIAYAVGNGATIYKSTNNGGTFSPQPIAPVAIATTINLNSVVVADQLTAYALGSNSTILKTTDGGLNWLIKASPLGAGSANSSVYNLGNNNIIVAGAGAPSLFNIKDKGDDYSTRFYYDALGRLIISQNSKQYNKVNRAYSYTVYDAIGRISQVGEIAGGTLLDPDALTTSNGIVDITSFNLWLTTGTKTEVTTTVYDYPVTTSICGFAQENLRKRVSATYLDSDDNLSNGYQFCSLYTYDIHGNVKSLVNENPNLPIGHTCKKIDYNYDLISGKVNTVSYQKGNTDEFNHKYEYDADNRITNVFTSKDGYMWEQDAKYFYYLHGPLARVETGQEKIQGMDYAYTLQGWIKGINSGNLNKDNDIGKDGASGNAYSPGIADLNKFISVDAASYSLNYFGNDYKAINDANITAANRFNADATLVADVANTNNWLYNGNITSMATTIKNPLSPSVALPQLMTYKYDQLNRINEAKSYAGIVANAWTPTGTNNYKNTFTYDANGNIENQARYDAAGALIDNLTYNYHANGAGKKLSNRLYHVNDATTTVALNDDIEDQGAFTPAPSVGTSLGQINTLNNYAYDEIGNLTKDLQEGIQNIEWTVYGKIAKITRATGFIKPGATVPPSDLEFLYDASGNRVTKIVKPRTLTGIKPPADWTYTYYTRDAQGNVMATYEKQTTFDLKEHDIYGSSRLGLQSYTMPDNLLASTSLFNTAGQTYTQSRMAGNRRYELSNHLGNVLAVISDRKMPIASTINNTLVDHFEADIITSSDYYPFGSPMAGRTFAPATPYKYGFNGKEKDDEVDGGGNSYDYGERIYNSRLGRFLSVDPITHKYPMLTPYQFASNTPIMASDLDGKEADATAIYGMLWSSAGITTTTGDEVVHKFNEGMAKAARVSTDVLLVTGGVLTIVASGGAAAPIILGGITAGGGALKLGFDITGNEEASDKVPTTASGLVLVTTNYMVGEQLFSEKTVMAAEVIEGTLTLKPQNILKGGLIEKLEQGVGVTNVAITVRGGGADAVLDLLKNKSSGTKPEAQNTAPVDNTYVAKKPIIIPKDLQTKMAKKEVKTETKKQEKTSDEK